MVRSHRFAGKPVSSVQETRPATVHRRRPGTLPRPTMACRGRLGSLFMLDATIEELKELLKAVARAHHEATGGINAAWAEWYAEHLRDAVAPVIGANPSVEEIAGWLTAADIEYRAEERDVSWPRYYARFILSRSTEG